MENTEVKVIKNGPVYVKGNFRIVGTNGLTYDVKDEAWLCRCGASNNKPFCDGEHKKVGVRD
ncbi:CDGSH iron-sulfur domain-containing protein [Parabacteroides sp. FAFU027]|uniref:CDGSH iron-sulfur domain-containing protein n=1 Tax=Parabacteroides sp. FAFU027 TaxID=2922715 RepID=UPI001FAF3020|nr:CDGSH iron-sulfur domain-containing protein [Parabacteroides sp. FAFU027]